MDGEPNINNQVSEPTSTQLHDELLTIKADMESPSSQKIADAITAWQDQASQPLEIEASEHGYPIVDLTHESPTDAMAFLTSIDTAVHPVYHGMHNNEYRREAGMPDVTAWDSLDPELSHQLPERRRVYATTNLRGGIVHAVLETKKIDANPHSGEVYSLRPEPGLDGTPSFMEVSPHLDAALRAGDERFTDGLLYVLPSQEFTPNPRSSHEVTTDAKVVPLAVIRVGKDLGPGIVMPPEARYVRHN